MDCASWEVAEIDQYGRISLKPIYPVDSTERLDWLDTVDTGADLYKECCTSKGYTYGTFIINSITQQLILVGDEPVEQPTWNACVDTNFIPCTDIKDLKLILGSNGFSGFYLPQTDQHGCDCELNIRFDYMIKYNAESLIACAGIDVCPMPLDLYTNSIYNLDCRNFIVFTEGEQFKNTLKDNILHIDTDIVPLEGESLDLNKPDKDGIPNLIPYWDSNNIQVWQTPGGLVLQKVEGQRQEM